MICSNENLLDGIYEQLSAQIKLLLADTCGYMWMTKYEWVFIGLEICVSFWNGSLVWWAFKVYVLTREFGWKESCTCELKHMGAGAWTPEFCWVKELHGPQGSKQEVVKRCCSIVINMAFVLDLIMSITCCGSALLVIFTYVHSLFNDINCWS